MIRIFTATLVLASLLLAGCGWFDSKKQPLSGERIPVLSLDRQLEPDPDLAKIAITLPAPVVNPDWPEPGGYPNHAMQHLSLPDRLTRVWSTSTGEGASRYSRVLSHPIVEKGRVYAMDGAVQVGAYDAATGDRLWQVDLKPEDERGTSFGGGVAFWNDRLYASTGYVVTVENELAVLAADDGRRLWVHNGIPETASLLGSASPAVEGEVVVVAYSSGELYALTVETGRPLWSDNLASTRNVDAVSTLADIRGWPVIDRGRVFAASHSGRMAAIDLRSGERAWEQELGSTHSLWVAGDYVYILSNDNELICLTRNEGKVRWVRLLPSYENEKKRKDPMTWAGPVLGGDRLIVLSSDGGAVSISPYTGDPLGREDMSAGGYFAPVIADNSLYVLTDDAKLSAYR